MTCKVCLIEKGAIVSLDAAYAICVNCNSNCVEFYPRDAEHMGLIKNQHWFELTEPFCCPICGVTIKGGYFPCKDKVFYAN